MATLYGIRPSFSERPRLIEAIFSAIWRSTRLIFGYLLFGGFFKVESKKLRRTGTLAEGAVATPAEIYSSRRRAEFLLNNALDAAEYKRALNEVRKLGINPGDIPHSKP